MARKRQDDPPKGSPAWMNTFSDLMNLLLCFFVLLFSMSTVDADKYDQMIASLNKSFSIFSGGGSAIGEGQLISSGVSQLNELTDLVSELGREEGEDDLTEDDNPMKYLEEQRRELSEQMYDEILELTEKYNIDKKVDVNIDGNNQYIKLSIGGSILFDSGSEDIKQEALPILNKVGDILKEYSDCLIKIEGHTDNVPMSSNIKFADNMDLSTARAVSLWKYLTEKKGLDPSTLEASGRSEFDPIASNATPEGRAKNRRVEIKIYNELSR
ncbi:flagellar motor protein MotB [Anaerosporobacter sp.]|uniref:flagellar motor protein MotB n=1 Tax=Anaerosporobacter sp. TaxID=1872529 RepID=UPI00286FA23D|nr:flagellar motor protein MotB [Anaerosporobacter sp.]